MIDFPFEGPVDVLYVPQEVLCVSEGVVDLGYISSFCSVITEDKRYPACVSPRIKVVDDLCHYFGEVANGGHSQYLHNCEPTIERLSDILSLLQTIGHSVYAGIFRDLVELVAGFPTDPALRYACAAGHPSLAELDKRYFGQWYHDQSEKYVAHYLARQDWVTPVTRKQFFDMIQNIRKARSAKAANTLPSRDELRKFVKWTFDVFAARSEEMRKRGDR